MLAGLDASRCTSETERRIVPFVSDGRESESVTVCVTQEDEIHWPIEAMVELILVAAGVAGIVSAMC